MPFILGIPIVLQVLMAAGDRAWTDARRPNTRAGRARAGAASSWRIGPRRRALYPVYRARVARGAVLGVGYQGTL